MEWGLFKASRLLKLASEKDERVNKEYGCIRVVKGNSFSMKEDIASYTISICDKAPIGLTEFFNIYFDLQDQSDYMFKNFYECFCTLHEVGHIVNNEGCDKVAELNSFYNGEYSSSYEEYKAYRQLSKEAKADQFALDFIRNNKIEIYMLMNDMTKEEAQAEVDFWSSI